MNVPFDFGRKPHIRSGWNVTRMLVRGKLTDKQIARYQKDGWYSQELKDARKELQARQKAKKTKRDGSFLISEQGRMIYSPI